MEISRAFLPVSLKPHTRLNIATWNVEGLKEVTKYDQILIAFARKHDLDLLAMQETKADSSHSFCKPGWEILHSSTPAGKHRKVGFMISPLLRPYVTDFLAHGPRICDSPLILPPTRLRSFVCTPPVKLKRHRRTSSENKSCGTRWTTLSLRTQIQTTVWS